MKVKSSGLKRSMPCNDLISMGRQESLPSLSSSTSFNRSSSLFPQDPVSGGCGGSSNKKGGACILSGLNSNKRIRISLTFTFEHECGPATAALEHSLRLDATPFEFGLDCPSPLGSYFSCATDYTSLNDIIAQRKSVIPSVHDVTQGMARITASS